MLTYPWFLAKNFDESYNFGLPGAGNEYIFHSLIDADSRFKFTQDDVVIVCWTGIFRMDMSRIEHIDNNFNSMWIGNGDTTHYKGDLKEIKKFYTDDFLLHKSINYMAMTKRFLNIKNINYRFTSIYDLKLDKPLMDEIYDDKFLEPEGLVKYVIKFNNIRNAKKIPVFSGHPSFSTHYLFAEKFAKSLAMTLPNEIDEWKVIEENIHVEQNLYDRYNEVKTHPLYSKVYENLVLQYIKNESHTIFPNCYKFNQNSSNLYKQILLDVFA
jgi:hypothetical protein